jgi:tetratricopeptide (TPR) repeat protein
MTRSVELKRLMGHDYVCTCERCRYEQALSINDPKGSYVPSCSLDTHVLKCIADLAMQQSRFEDALTAYNNILLLCPNDGEILHARAASSLGRASACSFATVGHCHGNFIKAQRLWEEAGSIHSTTHAGIAIEVVKQRVYRTLEQSVDEIAIYDSEVAYTTLLDGKCFLTNDTSAIISMKDCQMVIQCAESYAAARGNSDGWTTSRHYAVPTTDIPVHELTELHSWFYELWTKQIRLL